jgi:hypothetical protein
MKHAFTPKILIGGIVLFLTVAAGFLIYKPGSYNAGDADQVPPSDADPAASGEKSDGLGEYYDGSSGAEASSSATPVPSPAAITEYTYPLAQVTSSASAKLEMQTSENPVKVTDWYKNKIDQLKFNAKSFVSSGTNGDIFNKLSAAKPGEKIEVTIKKDQNGSNVLITVDRF